MRVNVAFFARLLLLGFILPIIMSAVVYQGFSSNYTVRLFSEQGFRWQYETGVYKYRVLGRFLLIGTYRCIQHHDLPTIAPLALRVLDQRGDPQFYSAYFYLNTIFLCLTCLALFFALGGHRAGADFLSADLPVLFLMSLMTLSQYVVVPYDMLSYFFLAVAAWLVVRGIREWWEILASGAMVVLGTLTRETTALILALHLACNYRAILTIPVGMRLNHAQRTLVWLTACFVATYLGLRIAFGYERPVFETMIFPTGYDVSTQIGILAFVGIAFLAGIVLLLFSSRPNVTGMWVFLLASLPYLGAMPFIATTWEIRLWVPVILLLTIIKVNASRLEGGPESAAA